MGILSNDFAELWCDWKSDLYIGLDLFIDSPCVEHHDTIVHILEEHCEPIDMNSPDYLLNIRSNPVIAVCNENRRRDAIAIMTPISRSTPMLMTWKCSKHTPMDMRGTWIMRRRNNTYINDNPKFIHEHKVYILPEEVSSALLKQFKVA